MWTMKLRWIAGVLLLVAAAGMILPALQPAKEPNEREYRRWKEERQRRAAESATNGENRTRHE